ncbi:MAG: transposase [Planctomycetaceae bacterium]|nr:transposase [Planctomycetaceae bacterium]
MTFTTYGTWLHGDKRGSYKKGQGYIESKDNLMETVRLKEKAVILTNKQRELMDNVIVEICQYRSWELHARNVRTNHIHIVVTAQNTRPEKIINDFKAERNKNTPRIRRISMRKNNMDRTWQYYLLVHGTRISACMSLCHGLPIN